MIIIQDAINRAIEKTPATEDVKNKIIAESIDILNRDIVAYEKDRKTVDFLADSLLQYLKNRVSSYNHNSHKSLKNLDRDLILRESIRLAITSHLWSKYSTRDFVENLTFFVGGTEEGLQSTVIRAYLEIGLCYETHQDLFDKILESEKKSRELVFPRARYPSRYIKRTKTDISYLLGKGKQGHHFEKPIPEYVCLILSYLDREASGIYPFYSKARKGSRDVLCALIIKEDNSYLYLKNLNRYFEFEGRSYESDKSRYC